MTKESDIQLTADVRELVVLRSVALEHPHDRAHQDRYVLARNQLGLTFSAAIALDQADGGLYMLLPTGQVFDQHLVDLLAEIAVIGLDGRTIT